MLFLNPIYLTMINLGLKGYLVHPAELPLPSFAQHFVRAFQMTLLDSIMVLVCLKPLWKAWINRNVGGQNLVKICSKMQHLKPIFEIFSRGACPRLAPHSSHLAVPSRVNCKSCTPPFSKSWICPSKSLMAVKLGGTWGSNGQGRQRISHHSWPAECGAYPAKHPTISNHAGSYANAQDRRYMKNQGYEGPWKLGGWSVSNSILSLAASEWSKE